MNPVGIQAAAKVILADLMAPEPGFTQVPQLSGNAGFRFSGQFADFKERESLAAFHDFKDAVLLAFQAAVVAGWLVVGAVEFWG